MPSLLIVDDSPISRKILRKCLPPGDFQIREVGSGEDCLKQYQAQKADLVFLDLTMPGMDGFETLEHLRRIDPGAKVVVVTADIQSTSRAKARDLGALEVVAKPPKPETISQALELALR